MFWRGGELGGILKWQFPDFGWLPLITIVTMATRQWYINMTSNPISLINNNNNTEE